MKRVNNDKARHIRLRAVVAYPAVSVALVVALALVLNPLGTSQVMALDATPTPTETAAGTATDVPSPTTTDAPSPTTTGIAGPTATDSATTSLATTPIPDVTPSPGPIPSLASLVSPLVAAGISVDHHILAAVSPGVAPTYLALDASVPDGSQFQTFRVRFQVQNTGTAVDPIVTTPRLEYRVKGSAESFVVPEKPEPGIPFHMAGEWVAGTNGGTVQGPLAEDIAVEDFRTSSGAAGGAVKGHHSMSKNPDVPITLPAASHTEEEFTVALSIDAQYNTIYELRITEGGADIGPDVANIGLGIAPTSQSSPAQRDGTTVADPSAVPASGLAYPLLNTATTAATTTSPTTPAISPSGGTLYPLASGSLSPAVAPSTVIVVGEPSTTVHGQCDACHRGHTAQAPNLLAQSTQSALCFSCHDGSAAATSAGAKDVKSQYALDIPVNVPEKREYYSHDAITSAASTPATERQSDCADCHNSHRAKSSPDSTQVGDTTTPPLSTGWDVAGPLTGVSGVSVVNGAAGEAPTSYEVLDGIDKPVTREYQLCFKCHSGAATLTSNTGLEPSQYALDKAVEFNPANPSFHPVEAAGTNGTDKMKASLAGQSPYKLWNFNIGSTVRCLNCHASTDTTAPQPPAAGGDLAPHTSSNRGILLRNYLDRELKPRVDSVVDTKAIKAAYSAGDFALCFVCHGEEPFANAASPGNATATNFAFHGLHLTGLKGKGDAGTDIDSAGAGQGNAICAECHFRIHSTTNKVGSQVIPGSRLVNFAPDVQPVSASEPVAWTAGAAGTASCTLTCHGYTHVSLKY